MYASEAEHSHLIGKRLRRERSQIRRGWLPTEVVLYNRIYDLHATASDLRMRSRGREADRRLAVADGLSDELEASFEARGFNGN